MTRPPQIPPNDGGRPSDPIAGDHLSEEDLVAELGGGGSSAHRHLAECAICRARLELARDLLRLDGLASEADHERRVAALIRRLEAARRADSDPARMAVRRPAGGGLALDAQGAEVFARSPALALRRAAEPLAVPLGCRRRFGEYEVEVEVSPSPGGAEGQVDIDVRLAGPAQERANAALLCRGRELAARPLGTGRATFRALEPGHYTLAISDRRVVVGRILIDVGEAES